MNTKQIIVMRKFPSMRTGKYATQASHASMAFLTENSTLCYNALVSETSRTPEQIEEINHWLHNSFRKITCYVNTEEEIREIYQKALDSGIIAHLIEDNGLTEFKGVKTVTCCAIGPTEDSKLSGVTDKLPLF